MKIGYCAKLDLIRDVAAAGFDYIEPPVSVMAAWTDEEFEKQLRLAKDAALPVPSFNLFLPGDIALFAPETDDQMILSYLRQVFPRVEALGGRVVVFGSGRSRTRPENMTYGDAFRRLTEISRLIGEAAKAHGITVVIEPLNHSETNMINSVPEGADLAAAVNHPNIQLLADYFHIARDGQPTEDVARVGGIAHCHIATLEGRRVPLAAEDGFRRMFTAMKQTNYSGLISVEGKADDLVKEGPVSVKLLKALWEEA